MPEFSLAEGGIDLAIPIAFETRLCAANSCNSACEHWLFRRAAAARPWQKDLGLSSGRPIQYGGTNRRTQDRGQRPGSFEKRTEAHPIRIQRRALARARCRG